MLNSHNVVSQHRKKAQLISNKIKAQLKMKQITSNIETKLKDRIRILNGENSSD